MKTQTYMKQGRVEGNHTAQAFRAISLAILGFAATSIWANDVLVPAGSVWKYLDNGTDQGTNWFAYDFNDSTWASGPAELGYGDTQATKVSYGTVSSNKFITTYFRCSFTVDDPSTFTNVLFELLRDDGAVVFLNGREIFRSNLPAGAVNYQTKASANVGGSSETTYYPTLIPATNLLAGLNVLAVEIHQSGPTSGDISFDLKVTGMLPPLEIILDGPENGAEILGSSANLGVTVTNTTSSDVTVTYYGRVAAEPVGPDFSIVALPDTQCYVASLNGGSPLTFVAQADWIATNREALNLAYVAGLGDIVQNGDTGTNEWYWATNALYRLENPELTGLSNGIPYGLAIGNHDQWPMGSASGTTFFYSQFFGVEHFAGRPYYGGHFGTNNDNHYQLFSASGMDFIVVHLEYDTTTNRAVLEWANQLLQSNVTRRAILVSHYLINSGFNATFSAQGRLIYENLKTNANLFLMLSGHVSPEEGQRQDIWNGQTVYTLMSDYQNQANGGNGYLRVLEFSPSNNVIRVKTYSPTLGQFRTNASSQFELVYDMRNLDGFVALATNNGVAPGVSTSLTCTGLLAETAYEWFVAVQDGENVTASPIWRFTAATNESAQTKYTGASVTPTERPTLTMQLDKASGQIVLSWNTQAGKTYRVMSKDTFNQATWTDLSPEIAGTGTAVSWAESFSGSAPTRFYAIRVIE